MKHIVSILALCAFLSVLFGFSAQSQKKESGTPVRIDPETFSGLGARNIGSATMSGRIAAIDAVHEDKRLTIYVGSASGGVWKSMNGGTTYKPVFDKESVMSIGAVTIDPANSKTIWVGTGECWTRNSVSIGDGIYKSTDGGETWTNMGLKESERISKIIVDPTDSKIVYVAVPGKLWSDGDERGLYKTTDGGTTWNKILAGSNLSTGCSMISIDKSNPKTIYACMWDFRRKGWTFRSGGDSATAPSGSGFFKSTDGGATWSDLNESTAQGLPAKPWGRLAVAVAPSRPQTVYCFVECAPPNNGLYRSDDGGKTWIAEDRSQNMLWRPFYFANLIVDPKNPEKLYKTDGGLIMSDNGGKSFNYIGGGAHGDFHDVWIDTANTDYVITVDDGGIWYSFDGANNWWKGENLPISQFYHVSLDMARPFNVYGGLQDNSSWVAPSQFPGGIANSNWENMYGGDGFWMFLDPSDTDYIYAESQGGAIGRVNRKTHEVRDIKPLPGYKEGKLRYNWNTPIHVSPTMDGTIYLGSQFLFRSKNHGQKWDRISPDLTTNDPEKLKQEQSGGVTIDNSSAEMHCTIYSIAESPKNSNVIWVGTDDGNLQVTRDGGKNWENVVGNIKGLPKNAWVSYIDAGHFNEGTAYATFDLHTFGDMKPYVYRTTDFGKTWFSLVADNSPMRGYAHVVREDLVRPDLLFVGTEFGLWISLDGGKQFAQYKGGELPDVAVRDIAIHPRDNSLVLATHGRGIWIVDDITPLRSLTPEVLAQNVAFLQIKTTEQTLDAGGGWVNGDQVFTGPNPTTDATIVYYQKKRHIFGDLKIEIFSPDGKSLGTIPSSKRRGLNRATWGMRLKAPKVPTAANAGGAGIGPRVLPGVYTVKLTKDKDVLTTKLTVLPDPRLTYTEADHKAQFNLSMKLYDMLSDMTYLVDKINGVRSDLDSRSNNLTVGLEISNQLKSASAEADVIRKEIVATKEGGMITGEERLREYLCDLYNNVVFYDGPPTQTEIERTDALKGELSDVSKKFDNWITKNLNKVNSALSAKELKPITILTREEWEKTTKQE